MFQKDHCGLGTGSRLEGGEYGTGQLVRGCHGLTDCVPLKFICCNPNPQCDGISRWGFGR